MYQNRIQYFADILILIGFAIIGALALGTIGLFICSPLFKMSIGSILDEIQNGVNSQNIHIFKIYNLFVSIGMWVLSAYILIKIRKKNHLTFWQFNTPNHKLIRLFVPAIFICSSIISVFLLKINQSIPFPDFLKSWLESTKDTQKMMATFLTMETPVQLVINLILVAVLPAICEEIFFRGTLQKLMIGMTGNMHLGIIITSFLFAAIHMNALQIIPMFFLALVLGYLYQFTQSIWPSIALHFLNNGIAVLGVYYQYKNKLANQLTNDTMQIPIFNICIAALLLNFIFILLYKNYQKTTIINE